MALMGREAIHKWFAPGTDPDTGNPDIELNLLDDETTGAAVWPRFRLLNVNHGFPAAGDTSDKRVGASGAINRPDYRGRRLHSYEIEVKGRDIAELRQGEETLRAAFQDQSDEGQMRINRHALEDSYDADDERFINAKALILDPAGDYVDTSSPHQGVSSLWTLGLSNGDGRYFEELTLDAFKQAIIDLEPALYWALDADDGATDLSGNGRNGTAQGSATIGAAAALTPLPGDSATNLDGANDAITSSYDPFAAGSVRTFFGLASRDALTNSDTLIGGDHPAPGLGIVSGAQEVGFTPNSTHESAGSYGTEVGTWPGLGEPVPWAFIYDDGASEGQLFLGTEIGATVPILSGGGPGLDNYDPATDTFQVGSRGLATFGTDYFDGIVGHTGVLERAVTPEEWTYVADIASTGLRGYW